MYIYILIHEVDRKKEIRLSTTNEDPGNIFGEICRKVLFPYTFQHRS